MSRVRVKRKAGVELTRRYRVRERAELELSVYLRGIADSLGVDLERIEGFDDQTNELLLTDAE